jgi:hypothetical protein
VTITKSSGDTKLDGSGTGFANGPGAAPTAPAFDSWTGSATVINLGSLNLTQEGRGYDSDLTNQYLLSRMAAASGTPAIDGKVEVDHVELDVSATEGFVVGGALFLNANANCTTGTPIVSVPITTTNAGGPVKLTLTGAQAVASFLPMVTGTNDSQSVYICYRRPATSGAVIPSSAFSAVGRVYKAKATTAPWGGEQDNICDGGLYALSGGIKIDVRNYANSRVDGWYSVIRIINTSEKGTARVRGQIIEPSGKFGPSGVLVEELGPRAVINLSAQEIDGKLTDRPDAGTANNGSATPQPYDGSGAPRLRITAEGVDTLRVQNYMVQPGTGAVFEFSSAQGVDFSTDTSRAGGEGQYISQDARTGINGE